MCEYHLALIPLNSQDINRNSTLEVARGVIVCNRANIHPPRL